MRQKRSLCSGTSPASSPLRLTVCCPSFFLFFFHPRLLSWQPRSFFGGEMFSRPVVPFYLRSRGDRRRTAVLSPRSFLIIKTPQTSPFHHRPPSNIGDTAFGVSTALTKKNKMYGFKKVLYCEKRINWVSEAPRKVKSPSFIYLFYFLEEAGNRGLNMQGFFWWGVLGLSI